MMMKKVLIAGATGAAVLGVGVAALAETTTAGPTPTPSTSTPSTPGAKHAAKAGKDKLSRVEHGEFVTSDKGKDVTHDVIHGGVTAVSATSISVKAKDGFTLTYTVGSTTKVIDRTAGKGSAKKGTMSDVKAGQDVVVTGVKSGTTLTAEHVVDLGTK